MLPNEICVPDVYARFTVSILEAKREKKKKRREKLLHEQASRESTSELGKRSQGYSPGAGDLIYMFIKLNAVSSLGKVETLVTLKCNCRLFQRKHCSDIELAPKLNYHIDAINIYDLLKSVLILMVFKKSYMQIEMDNRVDW